MLEGLTPLQYEGPVSGPSFKVHWMDYEYVVLASSISREKVYEMEPFFIILSMFRNVTYHLSLD